MPNIPHITAYLLKIWNSPQAEVIWSTSTKKQGSAPMNEAAGFSSCLLLRCCS